MKSIEEWSLADMYLFLAQFRTKKGITADGIDIRIITSWNIKTETNAEDMCILSFYTKSIEGKKNNQAFVYNFPMARKTANRLIDKAGELKRHAVTGTPILPIGDLL
jgi:hypothetical protein